jgi:hypothetical protein
MGCLWLAIRLEFVSAHLELKELYVVLGLAPTISPMLNGSVSRRRRRGVAICGHGLDGDRQAQGRTMAGSADTRTGGT